MGELTLGNEQSKAGDAFLPFRFLEKRGGEKQGKAARTGEGL